MVTAAELPTLQTRRLTLRSYRRDDIPALIPLIGAKEVAATTLRIPHPYRIEHAEAILHPSAAIDTVRYAVTLQGDGTLIGGVGMRLEPDHDRAEIGYWIGVPYWGNGYATEAAFAVVRYGFDVLNLHRIQAEHFAGNTSSGRVLQKLGMKYEGCQRQHLLKWGEYLDVELYGILRSEFDVRPSEAS